MATIRFPRFKNLLLCAFAAAVLIFYFTCGVINWSANSYFENNNFPKADTFTAEKVVIATTICGKESQIDIALLMMKSAILFCGEKQIHFLVVCAKELRRQTLTEMERLRSKVDFTYELQNIFFPEENESFWRSWYKECATQRLFLPNIFPHVGKVLYIDNDVLFLNELDDLWQHTHRMNQSQIIAAAPEFLDLSQQLQFEPQFPLNKAKSLNAGILIMDLRKMVEFGWYNFILTLTDTYHPILRFADQDLIRLAVFFHPDKLYLLSCHYNFKRSHCWSTRQCRDAEIHGVSLLHGSSQNFKRVPTFKAVHDAFEKYQIGMEPKSKLADLLKKNIEEVTDDEQCGKLKNIFLKNIHKLHYSP